MPDNFIPGSGASQLGYAQTIPDNSMEQINLAMHLQKLNQDRSDKIDQDKKDKAAHEFALEKYYGTAIDPGQFATDTPYDSIINNMASKSHKDLTDIIHKGGPDSAIDAENFADQAVSNMRKYYNAAKATSGNIKNSTDALRGAENSNIDADALFKAAHAKAFYKTDTNGQLTNDLYSPEELNQNRDKNYVHDLAQSRPDLFLKNKGGLSLDNSVKNLEHQTISGTSQHYVGANKKTFEFNGTWNPAIDHVVEDKNGYKSVVPNTIPVMSADGKPVIDPQTGKPVQRAAPGVASNLIKTPQDQMALDWETKQALAAQGMNNVDPNSEVYKTQSDIILAKKYLPYTNNRVNYKQLQAIPANQFKSVNNIYNAPPNASQIPSSFEKIRDITVPTDGTLSAPGTPGYNAQIKGGIVYAPDGKQFNGNIQLPLTEVPEELRHSLRKFSINNDLTGIVKRVDDKGKVNHMQVNYVPARVVNGQIQAVQTDDGTYFDRNDDINSKMEENNKNVGKYKLPIYGKKIIGSAVKDNREKTKSPAQLMREAAGIK